MPCVFADVSVRHYFCATYFFHSIFFIQKREVADVNQTTSLPNVKDMEQVNHFFVPLPVFFFLVVLQAIVNTSFL